MAQLGMGNKTICVKTVADSSLAITPIKDARREVCQLIVPMSLNGSGVRDITRVLCVCINTVLKKIRVQALLTPESAVPPRLAEVEVDEMWSFVEHKADQAWLWYAFEAKPKAFSRGLWVAAPIRLALVCLRS